MQNTKCFIIAAICFSILGLFGKTLKAERFTRSGSGTYDDPYKILFMYDSDDGSGIFSVRGQTVVDTSVGAGVFHREFKQKCEYHDLVPWGTDPNATILEKNYSGWDVTETEDAVVNSVGIKTLFNYVQVNQTVVNISGGLGVRDEEDQLRTGLVITSTIWDAGTLTEQFALSAAAFAKKPLAENSAASTIVASLDVVSTRNGYGPYLNPLYDYEIKIRRRLGSSDVFEGTATNDSPQMASDPMAVSLWEQTDLDEELVRDWPLSYVLQKQYDYQSAIFPKIPLISSWWSPDKKRYYYEWPDQPRT